MHVSVTVMLLPTSESIRANSELSCEGHVKASSIGLYDSVTANV
ncbi:hypothetical protein DEAB109302_14840 [Dermacoccus abyssi]